MMVIKRKTERKFYEYLLHHCLAVTLMLFSMMSNQITLGAMILVVHDMSDIMIALGRALVESKLKYSMTVAAVFYAAMTLIWIYLRLFIYPFCFLAGKLANIPTP